MTPQGFVGVCKCGGLRCLGQSPNSDDYNPQAEKFMLVSVGASFPVHEITQLLIEKAQTNAVVVVEGATRLYLVGGEEMEDLVKLGYRWKWCQG